MSSKKTASVKAKGRRAGSSRKRNPEGLTRVWGAPITESAEGNGSRKNGRTPGRKRNPAGSNEESEEILKANELLLQVWEHTHAKRDSSGKLD